MSYAAASAWPPTWYATAVVELLQLLLMMLGSAAVGGAVSLIVCALVVIGKLRQMPMLPGPEEVEHLARSAGYAGGERASVRSLGGVDEAPSAERELAELDLPKTRQKPRCALCEALRQALGLSGKKLAGKQ